MSSSDGLHVVLGAGGGSGRAIVGELAGRGLPLRAVTRGPVLDAVTARAVSALRTLIPLTAPLLRSGGELILLKGANAQNEIAAAEKAIRKYKLQHARVEVVGEGVISEPTRVIRATAAG